MILTAEPWVAVQMYRPPLPTYGIWRSWDGSLFFVWLLQNRHHAGQKVHSPEENLSAQSLRPASAQDGCEGKEA